MKSTNQRILSLAESRGFIRASDLKPLEIPRIALTRLMRQGQLIRIDRGVYTLPDKSITEHSSLAEAARKCPQGIICLLSALRFHELTTQSPFEVWLAIPNKARAPKMQYPPLRITRFSDKALVEGVEQHNIDGVNVQVTGVARTVVDCFKFRNKIGLDVTLEALHDAWNNKRIDMDELWYCATQLRVANVMRPYMESLS